MLAAKNAKTWFTDLDDAIPLAKWVDDANKRSSLEVGDLILSTRGTIGNCALVVPETLPANLNQDVARIHVKSKSFTPEFLLAFINSEFGQDWITRNKTGMVQQGITLAKLQSLMVPQLSLEFQKAIKKIIELSHGYILKADMAYSSAESLLLSELGIGVTTIPNGGTSVKSFSESFGETGRLDAEYYQPKYDLIKSTINRAGTIGTLCNIYDHNFVPDKNKDYKYIELANIGKSGEIDGVGVFHGSDLPTRARRLVKSGDVVVSSVEGSLESIAIITDSYDNAVCSTGFYVVNSDIYNSETLLVLLKSPLLQDMLKRGCSGTILTSISKEEFLDIPLPSILPKVQEEISQRISNAYNLWSRSQNLLDNAAKAVEIAIKQDESTATDWLSVRTPGILQ